MRASTYILATVMALGVVLIPLWQGVAQPSVTTGETLGLQGGAGALHAEDSRTLQVSLPRLHELAGRDSAALREPRRNGAGRALPEAFGSERFERLDRSLRLGRFEAMDRNGDGRISSAEWQGSRREFARLDRNGDGYLTPEELFSGGRALDADRERWALFHRFDRNGDGVITPDEWPGSQASFELRDADGDGALTLEEMVGLRPEEPPLGSLSQLDLDDDGLVRRAEWVGCPFRFERLDRNGDGALSRWELLMGRLLRA